MITITVEENIHIEFDRFFNKAKFKDLEISNNLKELLEELEDNVIQEYSHQMLEVYDDGYGDGRDHGYDDGYSDGYETGVDEKEV